MLLGKDKIHRRNIFLNMERVTAAWEAQCPFVYSHKKRACAVAQNLRFVQWHKIQMSNALSEAPQIQESVARQQVAATEGG